jgi:YHS domain-containing protein
VEETFGLKDYWDGSRTLSVDPVCGATVDEGDVSLKTEYAGQTYYFCSPECRRNFELDPAFYIGQPR